MNKKRPVNLDIRTIQLPLTALTSILHRISGIMLFIFLGLILYMLSKSLESEKGFNEVKEIFSSPFGKVSFWLGLYAGIPEISVSPAPVPPRAHPGR